MMFVMLKYKYAKRNLNNLALEIKMLLLQVLFEFNFKRSKVSDRTLSLGRLFQSLNVLGQKEYLKTSFVVRGMLYLNLWLFRVLVSWLGISTSSVFMSYSSPLLNLYSIVKPVVFLLNSKVFHFNSFIISETLAVRS